VLAPDHLADEPQRLVRPGCRRHLLGQPGRRDHEVPRLELRILDDPDDPAADELPTERTEILLRFESGQAVANAIAAGVGLGLGNVLVAFGRKPGGVEKAFGLPPHYRFTWGHAIGYPLESADAGGQRPRLRLERLFHDNAFGRPFASDPAAVALLQEKGLIQEQAPLPGRLDEIVAIAERHGRDLGVLHFPAREIRRLLDDDCDLGPRFREHAEKVLATEKLPDYPDEMRETFQRLMEEHGIDASKFLPADG
jgi:hypothetical protein